MIRCKEVGFATSWWEDDCPRREHVEIAGPYLAILGAIKPTTWPVSFSFKATVQLMRKQRATRGCSEGGTVAIGLVLPSSTKPARSMTGRQCHSIVEKEQWSPSFGSIEGLFEIFEFDVTYDPERTVVMTFQLPVVVHQTPAISCEETTFWNCMKISKRTNPVAASHLPPMRRHANLTTPTNLLRPSTVNAMRIIAGEAGGRRLVAPDTQRTRPVTDRVREAVFSIIGGWVDGAVVLDLYAGSGSFGLEALSRGAEQATFVESGRKALAALDKNVDTIGLGGVIINSTVQSFLKRSAGPFDLVFMDPPWDMSSEDMSTDLADLDRLLGPKAEIIFSRRHGDDPPNIPKNWRVATDKRYGDTRIFRYKTETEDG